MQTITNTEKRFEATDVKSNQRSYIERHKWQKHTILKITLREAPIGFEQTAKKNTPKKHSYKGGAFEIKWR